MAYAGTYGSIEELKNAFPGVGNAMEKVREIFNGKYITNNAVENVWSHVVRINVISVLLVLGHGSLVRAIEAMVKVVVDNSFV